jgi:RNA polymerase sigma-70 factor (ECF subfamily)
VPARLNWSQISALYGELATYEPTAVTEANRAVAVAMSEGPAAGLAILDALAGDPRLRTWPQYHIALAQLLSGLDRHGDAADAYRAALGLAMPRPERAFIERRLSDLVDRP